jgi:hypothetical protein
VVPDVLYHNRGGVRFEDVTASTGVGNLGKGHGVSFGDIDNDGDQDIYHQVGGMLPGDKSPNALYENPGYGNHWLTLKLVGVRSNRAAIGARIRVVIKESGVERSIHSSVGSGGSFGANSLQQEIGLGGAEQIVRVEVDWPTSGTHQVLFDLEADRCYEIREDADRPRELVRTRLELGGR